MGYSRTPGNAASAASRPRLPRSIWALGFVSLFMDISSEMIHGLLPTFLVTVLGAGAETVGLIEGVGEATAAISKLFSGRLSDRLGKRKLLAVLGYALGALSKPLFALAPSASWVLAARFTDRIGKGVRDAPRDALIGDLVPPEMLGAAYGLRQALDTVGALAGPLLAMALMAAFEDDYRLVFWLAVIPGFVAVAILALGVRERPRDPAAVETRMPIRRAELGRLGILFWGIVGVATVLTLARFSEAFLLLRAAGAGLSPALVPTVLALMNLVYAVSAYPMGALSDRVGRKPMLAAGFGVLIAADVALALAPGIGIVMLGVALWGLHLGMTQGLISALVADAAPAELRGTAFGLFNFASGIALLLASAIAGMLWELIGPSATFLAGASFTVLGLLLSLLLGRSGRKPD
jgi:MFS family permease